VWLIASVAAVVGGLAVVIATWLESEARTDPVPAGPVSPQELRNHDLPLAWRGYAPGHVDALLARAATTLEQARVDAPSSVHEGTVPGFIAATFAENEADDTVDADDPYAWAWDDPAADDATASEPPTAEEPSGEELEDRGSDGPGSLDR